MPVKILPCPKLRLRVAMNPENYLFGNDDDVITIALTVDLHCRTRIQVPTQIWIPKPMATLYSAKHVYVVKTRDSDSDPHLYP